MQEIDKKINVPANDENKDTINMQKGPSNLPPKTPNYGKTPKYLEEYKKQAQKKEEDKAEAAAALKRPPGTRQLPEEERISTLETLNQNKKEVTKLLQ